MSTRKKTSELTPKAIAAVRELEKYVASTGLDKVHYKLIKIRASQLNGCGFCLDMHARQAKDLGVSEQRIYMLSAWREAGIYSEEEKAILASTEEVTLIANGGVSDIVYNRAVELLGEEYTKAVVMGVVAISAWNRIMITDQIIVNAEPSYV
ncbi:alkyl hydroperoxide reductase AhpD [Dyadobacter beijingensis]|uniref:Alkyl hydroperoxide reductase AhpD n=1 Tax=Dyadobacter beijingensis TaxID=365489 RepID=A0ABQ2I4J5_9BACT|nr:carboxymuconolactone decarboxylase family protein [Dyadobacter beijingensis]GGM98506.1 alkyl hydroperoxide reductase AhpD [Dyadobacter beijingensis]